MSFAASVHAKAVRLTRTAVEMTTAAGTGHPTSAASLAHIVAVLLYDHMRYDPAEPADPRADRLVISEGHACPIIYAVGADRGLSIRRNGQSRPMNYDDAMHLRAIDSPIDGHPNPAEGFEFFPAATGSLGQGLSIAAGLALAARLDGLDRRVFCLIGDGESREGQVWEAVDFIVDHGLTAVCPIFNCNGQGQAGPVSGQQRPERTADKLHAAGFSVRVIDGHSPEAIRDALHEHTRHADAPERGPFAIVARTQKAWSFSDQMAPQVHGKAVPEEDRDRVLESIDQTGRELGARWSEGDLAEPVPTGGLPVLPPPLPMPSFPEALRRFGEDAVLKQGKLAPRKAYGTALRALGKADSRVVALDGDVKNSTYSQKFADDPELQQRFFECKIAEQNMISCAAGLFAGGKRPFVSSFGKFLVRGFDQLELALFSRFPMKLVGSHVGVSLAADGPSQMALPDVAYFHAWTRVKRDEGDPFLFLLNPSDAFSAYALTLAMDRSPAANYLRVFRPDVPFLYDERSEFYPGGHQVLRPGNDLLLVATGYMVHEALRARERLAEDGIEARLVDLYSLPFDAEALTTMASECGGRVLTVEDNFGGGFGAAVAGTLAAAGGGCSVRQMFVRHIPKSGRTPDAVLRYLGLSADDIVREAHTLMESSHAGR